MHGLFFYGLWCFVLLCSFVVYSFIIFVLLLSFLRFGCVLWVGGLLQSGCMFPLPLKPVVGSACVVRSSFIYCGCNCQRIHTHTPQIYVTLMFPECFIVSRNCTTFYLTTAFLCYDQTKNWYTLLMKNEHSFWMCPMRCSQALKLKMDIAPELWAKSTSPWNVLPRKRACN